MSDSQPASGVLVRTFADGAGEYRCTAEEVPPSRSPGWGVQVDARFVGVDGVEGVMDAASSEHDPVRLSARPTERDLHEAIDRFVGDERRSTLIETSALTEQIGEMVELSVGYAGGLIHDPGLGVMDALPHASHVARVLAIGQGPEVPKFVSILVGLACGKHPAPPLSWLETPVGAIAVWEGLVEQEPFGEAMSASAAAATLGEDGRDAIVRLVNDGYLDRHPVTGVTRASVRALLAERDGASRPTLGDE